MAASETPMTFYDSVDGRPLFVAPFKQGLFARVVRTRLAVVSPIRGRVGPRALPAGWRSDLDERGHNILDAERAPFLILYQRESPCTPLAYALCTPSTTILRSFSSQPTDRLVHSTVCVSQLVSVAGMRV